MNTDSTPKGSALEAVERIGDKDYDQEKIKAILRQALQRMGEYENINSALKECLIFLEKHNLIDRSDPEKLTLIPPDQRTGQEDVVNQIESEVVKITTEQTELPQIAENVEKYRALSMFSCGLLRAVQIIKEHTLKTRRSNAKNNHP